MTLINGGEMLVRVLEKEGVKQIYGLHGGHIDPIFQACANHNIAIYDTRHGRCRSHGRRGRA
jgi:acetolactate synthase-1/2/3 large subunit